MRLFTVLFFLLSTSTAFCDDEAPKVPRPEEVLRYQRFGVNFAKEHRYRQVPKEQGDEVLLAMAADHALESWYKFIPPNVICALPPPMSGDLVAELKDGSKYQIYFSGESLVHLPQGLYIVNEPSRARIGKVLSWIGADWRKEVISQPRPFTYTIGSVDDGGTLSGIARLFYGDAKKWKAIYQANRATIKDPNRIDRGKDLIIPDLDGAH